MDFQAKTEPDESLPICNPSGSKNLNMSTSEIVSALRAEVDRVEKSLLAKDAKHIAEIGPLQEKLEVERLMRLQAEQELTKKEDQFQEFRNKISELEQKNLELINLKRKRDSDCIVAELKKRVDELENANKKNLITIQKLRTENHKLARYEKKETDGEISENVQASVGGNTSALQRNIHTGHTLGAPVMVSGGHGQPWKGNGVPYTGPGAASPTIPTTPAATITTTPTTTAPTITIVPVTVGGPTLDTPTPAHVQLDTPTVGITNLSSGSTSLSPRRNATRHPMTKIYYDGKKGWTPVNPGLHKVTEVIQIKYDAPYKSFQDVPKLTRDMWWREWKKNFSILPEEETLIRNAFMYRCGKRMGALLYDIRLGRGSHTWLSDAHLQVLREWWASPSFKATQERAKANRASLKGGSLHTGGSTTVEETRNRLAKELQRPPTQIELFMETHMKKTERGKEWVDTRSERTYTEYTQKLEEAQLKYQTQVAAGETPNPIDEDLIWLQVVGGPYKGRVYGTGHYGFTDTPSHASSFSS